MTLREALKDILYPAFNVDAMLADPELTSQGGLEWVVMLARIYIEQQKVDTQAARELVAWDERRMSATVHQ